LLIYVNTASYYVTKRLVKGYIPMFGLNYALPG
jgi:hypothetical protein